MFKHLLLSLLLLTTLGAYAQVHKPDSTKGSPATSVTPSSVYYLNGTAKKMSLGALINGKWVRYVLDDNLYNAFNDTATITNNVAFINDNGNLYHINGGGFSYNGVNAISAYPDFNFFGNGAFYQTPTTSYMPIRLTDTAIYRPNAKTTFSSGASNPVTISSYQATYAATYGNHPTFVVHEFIGGNDTIINSVQPVLNYTSGLLSSIQFYLAPIVYNGYIIIKP